MGISYHVNLCCHSFLKPLPNVPIASTPTKKEKQSLLSQRKHHIKRGTIASAWVSCSRHMDSVEKPMWRRHINKLCLCSKLPSCRLDKNITSAWTVTIRENKSPANTFPLQLSTCKAKHNWLRNANYDNKWWCFYGGCCCWNYTMALRNNMTSRCGYLFIIDAYKVKSAA